MKKNRAIALGIVGGLVVIGGIVICVVLHLMTQNVTEGYRVESQDGSWKSVEDQASGPLWVFGFFFIVPGLIVFVAAMVQNKCMYVTACTFSIISLLLMGMIVFFGGIFLFVFILAIGSISEHCRDTDDGCLCLTDESEGAQVTPFKDCSYFSDFAALCIAAIVFVIISWVLLLAAFIMSIYFSCRSNTNQPGTVYAPVQQPHYPPPGYAFPAPPPQKPLYFEGGSQSYYEGPPSKV